MKMIIVEIFTVLNYFYLMPPSHYKEETLNCTQWILLKLFKVLSPIVGRI